MPETPAAAGTYRLRVAQWRRRTSQPGQPAAYETFHQGEEADLTSDEADRLLRAGAVEPLDTDTETEAVQTPQEQAATARDRAGLTPTVMQQGPGATTAGAVGVATGETAEGSAPA